MLPQQVGVLKTFFCASLAFIFLFSGAEAAALNHERKVENITGVVLAYDDVEPWLTCIDKCETSLIIRTNTPNEAPRYIRVELRFPDRRRFPKELIKSKRQWQFKLIRTLDQDEKIEEFIHGENVYGGEVKEAIWKLVPGAENEKLPFGEVVPTYSLVKSGFKPAGH